MIINRAKFEIADVRFNTRFNKVISELRDKIDTSALMMEVPSAGRSERYFWANAFPKVKEWLSDAQFTRLQGYSYQIDNKFWQGGIEILREDLDDDQLGLVRPQIDTLAEEFAYHPQDMMYDLMVNGFNGTLGLAYDNQYFYDTDHVDGTGASQSNKGTAVFSAIALANAIAQMRSIKDEVGRVLRVAPTDLYVGPQLEYLARTIINADIIVAGGQAQTNVMKNVVNLHVWNKLAEHPTYWFLFDESKSLKPFVHQVREPVQFAAQDRPTDDQNFMRRMLRWSAWSRDNAGYALWQTAWGSDGSV
jgi:phage major head subunit gpT-like protein